MDYLLTGDPDFENIHIAEIVIAWFDKFWGTIEFCFQKFNVVPRYFIPQLKSRMGTMGLDFCRGLGSFKTCRNSACHYAVLPLCDGCEKNVNINEMNKCEQFIVEVCKLTCKIA